MEVQKQEVDMIIGVPKEIKDHEYRVAATPNMVSLLVKSGHEVWVETQAGAKIGFSDAIYKEAGAQIAPSPQKVYEAEMIIKVKEPQKSEFSLLRPGQILFCYLHLAPDPVQTEALLKSKVVAIAYETVTDTNGKLPLLMPMSEIAGRLAPQMGAFYLQVPQGGKGLLLGGICGVSPARVVIIGGGAAGTEAARMALGLGADVTVLDRDIDRLRTLDLLFGSKGLKTLFSSPNSIEESVVNADLVIGAVLIAGKTAPKLITEAIIKKMSPGSVIVDIAIDQGGCAETSRPTSHSKPTYIVDGIIHYCVTNMPGACARTSSQALTQATAGFALAIANKGWKQALKDDPHLRNGLNLCEGTVTNQSVAEDLGYPYVAADKVID